MFTSNAVLRIAVQKSGRLSEKSLEIIGQCGIDFSNGSRVLKSVAENFPIEFLYLRDDDIPGYVFDGIADVGIVGRNEKDEKGCDVEVVRDLGFSKCRLSVAVPNSFSYKGLSDLEGKQIATSYPNILRTCLKEQQVSAGIHEISGSVEIAPAIGLTDAIFDIVSTGSTLISNGLKEVETLYRSSAVMIARKGLYAENPEKQRILERLLLRIDAVMRARHYKYIMFNLPTEKVSRVKDIIPGVKSPTVTRLLDEGWSSVQTVVQEDDFWDVFEALKAIGAQGILVTGIEQMAL
ncbi:MAG: ATP phosphoribosyltransferase [Spirochaetales bacterium]|jgi:ATP phosphoribosyltransferase|nr:ATP phosphoribosyltransferase [Spirochaetales bacterium]